VTAARQQHAQHITRKPTQEEHTMAGVESNDFSAPDEVRSPSHTTVELVKIGDGEVGRYTFQPGWEWSECIKPVVGTDTCQVEHVGYVVSGSMRIEHEDGTTLDITPGSVYRIAPGHNAHVLGSEPAVVVEFQGAATYAKA
jgi:hypothetical protein